jgi:hypothetical protein
MLRPACAVRPVCTGPKIQNVRPNSARSPDPPRRAWPAECRRADSAEGAGAFPRVAAVRQPASLETHRRGLRMSLATILGRELG